MSTAYILDTNIFIEAHRRYYAFDICPGFWQCLLIHGATGQIISIDKVKAELMQGNDALKDWAEGAPSSFFCRSATPQVITSFSAMMMWVQSNPQFHQQAKTEFAQVGDGWVAAYAQAHGAVLVTHEVFNPSTKRKVPLPNVCQQFNVAYTDTFEMLRQLGVTFN
ncbi:MAG: DUF4411 family protein [Cyanobacteriota bacterium]